MNENTRDWSSFRQWPTWLKVLLVMMVLWALLVAAGVVDSLIQGP